MMTGKLRKILASASGDSFLLMFVRFVTILFGLISTRIMAGHFSLTEYGTYSQVMLITTTVCSMTILGLMDGVNFFFCKEKDIEKRDTYISTIFFIQLIVGLVSVVAVFSCTVPIVSYFKNDSLKKLIVFAAVLPTIQNSISLLQILFIAIGKARVIAIKNLIVSVVKLAILAVACYVFDNIVFVLISQVLMDIIQAIYFFAFLRKKNYKIKIFSCDKALVREILSYCIPMAMFTVIKGLNRDCDKFVISYFTNTETLAIYTNASKILPFDIVTSSFCTILLPYITRFVASKDYNKIQRLYKVFLEISIISTVALVGGAICVAPEMMSFLYTDKYVDYNFGISVFIIYSIVDILSIFNITLILSAAGKTKTIMYISIGAFFANLLLNIASYPLLGEKGPALATLIIALVQGLLILCYSAKQIKCSLFDLFNKKFQLLFLFESVGIAFLIMKLKNALLKDINSTVVFLTCFAIYFTSVMILNVRRFMKDLKTIDTCKELD